MKKIERLGEYISEYSVRNKDNEDIQVYSVTNTMDFAQNILIRMWQVKIKQIIRLFQRDTLRITRPELMWDQ